MSKENISQRTTALLSKKIIALGVDIKNRFLVAQGGKLTFGPDIGDLSHADNFALFKKALSRAVKRVKPDIIACDLHPNYFSSLFAKKVSLQLRAYSLQLIQHHHAHIASVIQEHGLKRPVIGVCFDGTGFGQDGNSWGGEFLLVDKKGFRRLAHLKYRKIPGGDKAVFEPWRMVLSILSGKALAVLKDVGRQEKELILAMLAKNINCPLTSSAGRLFDAAAALLGICRYASFEAEGPIKLEKMSAERIEGSYEFSSGKENGCLVVDTDGLFYGLLKDLKQGKDQCLMASKFHNSMVEIIVQTAKRLSRHLRIKGIALSGGVFQNKFLKNKTAKKLTASGFNLFTNETVPVNDLNISLGQYYVSCCSGKS